MKLKYVIIGIVIFVIGVCCYLKFGRNKIKEEELDVSNIKSFYLTYTNGYMINAYTRYSFVLEDGNYIAEIKPYGIDEDDKLEIEVEELIIEKIINILKKYEVNKWDGFNKSDQGVLDGDSFSFSLSLNDNKEIHASGYMRWPNHFRDVRDEISPIFMEIYNKEKGIKEDGKV